MLFYILLILFFIPLNIVLPCRVVGKKNVPKKGRIIFSANHQTLNDPILVAYKLAGRRRFHYMAKSPLFDNKIKGAFLKKLGAYPVHCCSSDIQAVKTTMKLLKDDKAVCIFPEGSRLVTSEANELKHGVAMFSLRTQTPVIPAFFVKKTIAFVPNKLIIGKPLELYNMEQFKDKKIDKELLDEASNIIKKNILDLRKNYLKEKQDKKLKKLKKKYNRLVKSTNENN